MRPIILMVLAVVAVAVEVAAVVEAVVEVVEAVAADKNTLVMKNVIFHSVAVFTGWIWLVTENETYNPMMVNGPDFLKFYLILLLTFYGSVIMLKTLNESTSKITFYYLIFIFFIGIVRLIRGVILGRPVGYLTMILFAEAIVMLFNTQNSKK